MPTITELLSQGLAYHRAGQLAEAAQFYQQVLAIQPRQPNALHLMGAALQQGGQMEAAETYLRAAIEADPRHAAAYSDLGLLYQTQGRYAEAIEVLRQGLAFDPGLPEAWNNLGLSLTYSGRLGEAQSALERAVTLRPEFAPAHNNLGNVLASLNQFEAAAEAYRQALAFQPGYTTARGNYGAVLAALQRFTEAEQCFRDVLKEQPGSAQTWNNLAATLQGLGRAEEAIQAARRAVELQGDYADALLNLAKMLLDEARPAEAAEPISRLRALKPADAKVLAVQGRLRKQQGRIEEGMALWQRAVQLQPNLDEAWIELGRARTERGEYPEAADCYRRLVALQPEDADSHYQLANLLKFLGRVDESRREFETALQLLGSTSIGTPGQLDPKQADLIRYDMATLLPVVYESERQIEEVRSAVQGQLGELVRAGIRFDPHRQVLNTLFHLAYQGQNDRPILELAAELWKPSVPGRRRTTGSHSGRIRIGFASSHFRDHTVGLLWRGLIERLPRDRFHVSVFALGPTQDAIAQGIRGAADHYHAFPDLGHDTSPAADAIAVADLDLLYYPDLGMEPRCTALAAQRLAPIQCTSWGHPVTTGLKTVDYYLSSRLLEGPNAQEHYTERLMEFRTLGLYVYPPHLKPSGRTPSELGLPDVPRRYGCLQSSFKFHPAFDRLLAGILRADEEAVLVIPKSVFPETDDQLIARFRRNMPEVASRIYFAPRVGYADFLALTAAMDVLLVPPQFGGGRTSYEAIALGIPVVTLPSALLRGRITYGLYQAMGVPDCIAEDKDDYIRRAVRLATDREARSAVQEKIAAGRGRLFEDVEAVAEVAAFFEQAVRETDG